MFYRIRLDCDGDPTHIPRVLVTALMWEEGHPNREFEYDIDRHADPRWSNLPALPALREAVETFLASLGD